MAAFFASNLTQINARFYDCTFAHVLLHIAIIPSSTLKIPWTPKDFLVWTHKKFDYLITKTDFLGTKKTIRRVLNWKLAYKCL